MEKGYYKPEIEEFCVGFEIQLQNIENAQWGEYTITENDRPSDFKVSGDLQDDRIRIKFLDREDIESLGWRVVKSGKCPFTGKEIYKFYINEEIGFNTGTNWYLENENITLNRIKITIETYGSWSTSKDSINLLIKNKSELKKLMIQVGIKLAGK